MSKDSERKCRKLLFLQSMIELYILIVVWSYFTAFNGGIAYCLYLTLKCVAKTAAKLELYLIWHVEWGQKKKYICVSSVKMLLGMVVLLKV